MEHNKPNHIINTSVRALGQIPTSSLKKLPLTSCAIILNALPASPGLTGLRGQLASRLQNQLSIAWLKNGNASDVFATLTALWRHNPANITGKHLATILRRLIAAETAVGGPYRFKSGTVPAHIFIALFMRLVAKPLPNVEAFITKVIDKDFKDTNVYNPSLFLLAQAGSPKLSALVGRHCKQCQTPICLAATLISLKDSLPNNKIQHIINMLRSQQRHGFWQDRQLLAAQGLWESKLIATTLIIGALTNFLPPRNKLYARQQSIISAAQHSFALYAEPLRTSALTAIGRIGTADKNFEITLLSTLFASALKEPAELSPKQHQNLGLASLYGWIAYTIYDDFLDDKGQPSKLPVANIAMRASLDCFRAALPKHQMFMRHVANIFSTVDQANAWEVCHCRFVVDDNKITISQLPQFHGRMGLAKRSMAHALAPLAVVKCLPAQNKWRTQTIKAAFTHYLIARQLTDDLHDWAQDMQKGHASYVVTSVLRDVHIKPGTYNLAQLLLAMQKSFRNSVLPRVCQHVLLHISKSRAAFQKSQLLKNEADFYKLLDRLERAASRSLDINTKATAFYKAMQKTNRVN